MTVDKTDYKLGKFDCVYNDKVFFYVGSHAKLIKLSNHLKFHVKWKAKSFFNELTLVDHF